ncbi:hypothetical protein [Muribaculum intestinale]|uniref:hypothetical protein n=1 Tax=Muribaculum intestinale TaxID=1796646 RepID=UPI002430143A|nr:hypothetical protein [Muribaculum intestinale]
MKSCLLHHLKQGFKLEIEDYEGTEWPDSPNEYRIDTPFHDFEIIIGNGYMTLDSTWRYSQYFYISNNQTWLRDKFFDFITALGYKDAIIANEYHGWNHAYGDNNLDMCDYSFTFADWKKEFPIVSKIDFSCFHTITGLEKWPEIEDVYIDDFKECFERKRKIEERFAEYKILTIGHICGDYILALKDDTLVLLNEKTGRPLRCGKIDGINARFNNAGFAIIKGNKCAFYTPDGKRLTPYRVHQFDCKWAEGGTMRRVIYNTKTKEEIFRI